MFPCYLRILPMFPCSPKPLGDPQKRFGGHSSSENLFFSNDFCDICTGQQLFRIAFGFRKVETKRSKFAPGSRQFNITCQACNSTLNTLPSLTNFSYSCDSVENICREDISAQKRCAMFHKAMTSNPFSNIANTKGEVIRYFVCTYTTSVHLNRRSGNNFHSF